MAAIMGAMIGGGTAISGLASYRGMHESAKATKKATKLQYSMWAKTRDDLMPWKNTGDKSRNALALRMGLEGDVKDPNYGRLTREFGLKDFEADPGYQFRLSEGEKAIERAGAARGNFFSGTQGKALAKYGQDFASNEFQNAWNRDSMNKNALFERLYGISGSGQNAAAQTGGFGMNAMNNVGNALMRGADTTASGYNAIGNAINSGIGNYMTYDMLKNQKNYPGLYREGR